MNTRKVVINICFGGFSLSRAALELYAKKKGVNLKAVDVYSIKRDDTDLVVVVEELGAKANGTFAELKIVEIPEDVNWEIDEYDGTECVAEVHRTWR
jgi:hypothetical protein